MFNRVVEWTAPADIRLPQFRMPRPLVMPEGSEPHQSDWERVEEARRFLRQAGKAGDPFFLYVGLNLPHPPLRDEAQVVGSDRLRRRHDPA
jgi:hypothetical protein